MGLDDILYKRMGFLWVILFLLLLALSSEVWLFDVHDSLDSSNYLGYFLHADNLSEEFLIDYKASRVPWLIIGTAFFYLFDGLSAHYALVFSLLISLLYLFYRVIEKTTNKDVAIIFTIFYASYNYLHHNGGWYYHNIAVNLYLLGAILSLLSKPNVTSKKYLSSHWLLTGFLFASSVFINLFIINLSPILLIFYHYQNEEKNWIRLIINLMFGSLIALIFWGCINGYILGREFLFLKNQLIYTIEMITIKGRDEWHKPLGEWIFESYWLIIPFLTLIWSVIHIIKTKYSKSFSTTPYPLILIFVWFIHLFWQIKGNTALQPSKLSHNIFLPSFLTLAQLSYLYIFKDLVIQVRHIIWILAIQIIIFTCLSLPLIHLVSITGFRFYITLSIGGVGIYLANKNKPKLKLLLAIYLMTNILVTTTYQAYSFVGRDVFYHKQAFITNLETNNILSTFDPEMKTDIWVKQESEIILPKEGFYGFPIKYKQGVLFSAIAAIRQVDIKEWPKDSEIEGSLSNLNKCIALSFIESDIDSLNQTFMAFGNFDVEKVHISQGQEYQYWIGLYQIKK